MIKKQHILLTAVCFLIFLSAAIFAGSGFGNILVHKIVVYDHDGHTYDAKIYRPISASSMDLRPAVLITVDKNDSLYTADYLALELSTKGFVVLAIKNSELYDSSFIDAGYTWLATRSFTDHERIGCAAYKQYESSDNFAAVYTVDNSDHSCFMRTNTIPVIVSLFQTSLIRKWHQMPNANSNGLGIVLFSLRYLSALMALLNVSLISAKFVSKEHFKLLNHQYI